MTAGDTLTTQALLDGPYPPAGPSSRPFDVAPDGRLILIKWATGTDPSSAATIVIVHNWFEELKRLVPTN